MVFAPWCECAPRHGHGRTIRIELTLQTIVVVLLERSSSRFLRVEISHFFGIHKMPACMHIGDPCTLPKIKISQKGRSCTSVRQPDHSHNEIERSRYLLQYDLFLSKNLIHPKIPQEGQGDVLWILTKV